MAGAPAVQAANEQRDEAAAKVKASAEAESDDAAGGEDAAAAAGGAGAGAGAGATDGDAVAVAAAAAAKAEEDKKPKSLTAKCEADLSDLQKLWVQTLVSAYMAAQDSTTESEALKTVERSMVLVSHAPAATVYSSSSSVPSSLSTFARFASTGERRHCTVQPGERRRHGWRHAAWRGGCAGSRGGRGRSRRRQRRSSRR